MSDRHLHRIRPQGSWPHAATTERILAATAAAQGRRGNDFNWADEGEPVVPAFVCDSDAGDPDGNCGCGRAFAGTRTLKGTTTAVVAEVPAGTMVAAAAGWYRRFFGTEELDGELQAAVIQDAADIIRVAGSFPVGTVVERRGDRIQPRVTPPAPKEAPPDEPARP